MKLFVIEGAIGVGKSTLLKGLKGLGYLTYPEPHLEWEPWLKKYFDNPNAKEGIALQNKILHSIVSRNRKIMDQPDEAIIVERSLLSGREVFVPVNRQNHPHPDWDPVEEEYTKYIDVCKRHAKRLDIKVFRIGLKCDFPTIFLRARGRGSVDKVCTLDYHEQIFQASEIFHQRYCDYIIPVDDSFSEKECLDNVDAIIKGNLYLFVQTLYFSRFR